jgi:hypothetical protein
MMQSVHCSFVDSEKAAAGPMERTLSNCTCDLTKKEISVLWYLGDIKPIEGTNHMEDHMSDFFTFKFLGAPQKRRLLFPIASFCGWIL